MIEHDGCVGCKYENEPETFEHCYRCTQNAVDRYTPATNADRIRSMSDEELAVALMCPNEMGVAEIPCDHSDDKNCCQCLLDWLRQPAKDGANE